MHRDEASEIGARPCPKCQICETEGEFIYEGLRDRLYGVPGEWNLRQCPHCRLAWLDPMPLVDDVGKAYRNYYTHSVSDVPRSLPRRIMQLAEDSYVQSTYGYAFGINPMTSRLLAPLVNLHPSGRSVADCSVAYLPAQGKGAKLLDIGCGSGALAARMREIGWDAEGIDHDHSAVDAARSRGLTVTIGDIREQGYPDKCFDALCAKHVVEHVYDPLGFLRECRRVLRPGGKLVLITPNLQSMGHGLFGSSWLHLDSPRHLFLWCRDSLQKAVESQGLACERVLTSPRYANDAWSRSNEIKTHGHTDLCSGFGLVSKLRGIAFVLTERALVTLNPRIGDELVLIATRPPDRKEF